MNGKEATQAELDAAKWMAEAVNVHVLAQTALTDAGATRVLGFVGIDLGTGKAVDSELYERRSDVFRHHPHQRNIFPVKVGVDTMPEREALIVLQMARMAYRRGVIFSEEEVVTPHLSELMRPFIPNTLKGLRNNGHR